MQSAEAVSEEKTLAAKVRRERKRPEGRIRDDCYLRPLRFFAAIVIRSQNSHYLPRLTNRRSLAPGASRVRCKFLRHLY